MNRSVCSLAALFLICLGTTRSMAENWPQWRGPRLNGVSQESNIPVKWSKTENVVWRSPLPGPAGSTPIVWEDRIFLTSGNEDHVVLLCFDREGKQLWLRDLGGGNRQVVGGEGNAASPSPSTDGRHVWAFAGNGILACFDFAGEEVWKFDVQDRYGRFEIQYGMTSTPVLDGDRLYMQIIHGEGNPDTREALVVCLDKETGREIWKHDRRSDARAECEHSYASPTIYRDDTRSFLITHGADYVMGHDLESGKEIWRCGNLNLPGQYNPTMRFVASPVAAEGLIVAPTAKRGPVVAIRSSARGDVTHSNDAIAWRMSRNTPDVPSPLIHDSLVYLCREEGTLICLDAETGEKYYEKRTVRDRHRASPIYADGKIYCISRRGVVTVVKAGKEFEILAQNEMGEPITSSPVVSDGALYLRTFDALYAIRK